MEAIFFIVLGIGISPMVEWAPGVKQVQAFVRKWFYIGFNAVFGPRE